LCCRSAAACLGRAAPRPSQTPACRAGPHRRLLDDERFITPWRALFSARLGRPSLPIQTLLRLLYLKHRYQLGYQSLCREVADSISWRRFCHIGLDQPVPHPTTLARAGRPRRPQAIEQLNHALLGKLAADKLLRGRKLRIDTTVVEADIDHPTDADLLEHAVRTLGGLVRRVRQRGAATRTAFRDRSRAAGRRLRRISRTLRRRTGQAPPRSTGSPRRSPPLPGEVWRRQSRSPATPAGRVPLGPTTVACEGWWPGWSRPQPQPIGWGTRPASDCAARGRSLTG
jgi:IS5 family transposase